MRPEDAQPISDLCSTEDLYPVLLSHVTKIYCHGGGAKGRVLPKILELLQKQYGLPKKFQEVHGISVGNFIAMALMLGFTPEKMSHTLSQMPVESFKHKTLKRSIKFFITVIGYLFPKFANKLRNTFEWAFYDARGLREYFRRQIVLNTDNNWKDREIIDTWLEKPIADRLDPTFKEVYDRTKVLYKVHVTNANTNKTMIYSAEDTPDVPMSFAIMASASLPGVYPPVELGNEKKQLAWDGGMSDCMPEDTIPYYEYLHLHLMTPEGARVYFKDSEPITINNFKDAANAAFGDIYNAQYLHLSEKQKQASLAVVVPLGTLKYNITMAEQIELEKKAIEGVTPIYGIKNQLKVMAENILAMICTKREKIAQQLAQQLAQQKSIYLTFDTEEGFKKALENLKSIAEIKILKSEKHDSEDYWILEYQKLSTEERSPKTRALLTWYKEARAMRVRALQEKTETENSCASRNYRWV